MSTAEEKKVFTPRQIFWIRFISWFLCGCVAPFLFIAFRYNIFKKVASSNGTSISLTGWGIIAIILVAVFFINLFKYVKRVIFSKHIFIAQCISGVCKIIIPLLGLYVVLFIIQTNMEAFLQSLACTIFCELIAIPLNPMPKWAYEKQKELKEEERKDVVDYVLDSFFSRKEKSK